MEEYEMLSCVCGYRISKSLDDALGMAAVGEELWCERERP